MGQHHRVDRRRRHRRVGPVAQPQLLQPLEHAAIDQHAPAIGLDQVARPGHGAGGAQERERRRPWPPGLVPDGCGVRPAPPGAAGRANATLASCGTSGPRRCFVEEPPHASRISALLLAARSSRPLACRPAQTRAADARRPLRPAEAHRLLGRRAGGPDLDLRHALHLAPTGNWRRGVGEGRGGRAARRRRSSRPRR